MPSSGAWKQPGWQKSAITLPRPGYSTTPRFKRSSARATPSFRFCCRDLAQKPRLWVWALPDITQADPVPLSDRGNIAKMSAAWLDWARANGYALRRLWQGRHVGRQCRGVLGGVYSKSGLEMKGRTSHRSTNPRHPLAFRSICLYSFVHITALWLRAIS